MRMFIRDRHVKSIICVCCCITDAKNMNYAVVLHLPAYVRKRHKNFMRQLRFSGRIKDNLYGCSLSLYGCFLQMYNTYLCQLYNRHMYLLKYMTPPYMFVGNRPLSIFCTSDNPSEMKIINLSANVKS